jgi:rhamnogalacturonyl hydrolase YesR
MPKDDPRRPYYIDKLQQMAASIAKLQGEDGLWRPGLLDADDYPNPEVSGSAFFVYAMAWGIEHHVLDQAIYLPIVRRGWTGMVQHIYANGRLGCIQPIGAAPGAEGASHLRIGEEKRRRQKRYRHRHGATRRRRANLWLSILPVFTPRRVPTRMVVGMLSSICWMLHKVHCR